MSGGWLDAFEISRKRDSAVHYTIPQLPHLKVLRMIAIYVPDTVQQVLFSSFLIFCSNPVLMQTNYWKQLKGRSDIEYYFFLNLKILNSDSTHSCLEWDCNVNSTKVSTSVYVAFLWYIFQFVQQGLIFSDSFRFQTAYCELFALSLMLFILLESDICFDSHTVCV